MRGLFNTAATALALSCTASAAFDARIFADTNRDGVVDMKGTTDSAGKCSADTEEALFLPAITDTDRRCSKIATELNSLELDQCHDATDNVLRHPERLALVHTAPMKKLPQSARGTVSITCDKAFPDSPKCAENVRLFYRASNTGDWTYLKDDHVFENKALSDGLALGIDGRDVRRPGAWDGRVTLNFKVWDDSGSSNTSSTDCVRMRVSPILLHHHAQTAERVFTTRDGYGRTSQQQFVEEFREHAEAAGIDDVYIFEKYADIWTQDFFETGYTSIPGADGPVGIRVMIRSAQPGREAGRAMFEELRNEDVGAVQDFSNVDNYGTSIDSKGNLEAIPPYTNGNASYPAGRAVQGNLGYLKPAMQSFFDAQETQKPVELDTSFLIVGHVDEFMQFLPADNDRGFVLMIDDPLAGMEMLQNASAAGYGSVKAVSRPKMPYDDEYACLPDETIDEALERWDSLAKDNEGAAAYIEKNLEILKREIGLTDEEIFRLPALFSSQPLACRSQFPDDDEWPIETAVPGPSPSDATPGVQSLESPAKDGQSQNKKTHPLNIVDAVGGSHGRSSKPTTTKKVKINCRQEDGDIEYDTMSAFYPGIVNGIVLPNNVVLGPNPWGPVIDGVDILAQAAVEIYAQAGANLTFMDDWFSHHQGQGEVHCGTNSWRTMDVEWWKE